MMCHLHRLLAVAVIAALLAAPCLTVLGPLGVGTAHAGHTVLAEQADAAAPHHHHTGGGNAHSGAYDHRHAAGGGLPPEDPSHDELLCCCTCDGWVFAKATGKTTIPAQLAQQVRFPEITGLPSAHEPTGFSRERYRRAFTVDTSLPLGAGPVYAVTGRFRI